MMINYCLVLDALFKKNIINYKTSWLNFRRIIYKLRSQIYEIYFPAGCGELHDIKQMAEREGVVEQLKADNQMEWVGRMNNIRNRAVEIVNAELIYNWIILV